MLIHDSLWYVTGGLAWGTIKDGLAYSSSYGGVLGANTLFPTFPGGAASFSHTKAGWTIGTGVETKLWGGWSAKLEYLYVDLGSYTDILNVGLNPAIIALGPTIITGGLVITSNSHFTDNIVRVGLNYQFGSYAAPAVYR